jgi:hypothetical protein
MRFQRGLNRRRWIDLLPPLLVRSIVWIRFGRDRAAAPRATFRKVWRELHTLKEAANTEESGQCAYEPC